MSQLIVDSKRAKRINELVDWSEWCGGKECYTVKFNNVDGVIWVGHKMEIYNLLNKTDDQLQAIADSQ